MNGKEEDIAAAVATLVVEDMDIPASHSKLVTVADEEETTAGDKEETSNASKPTKQHPLRSYRAVTLGDSGVRCMLIQDVASEKAALSTTVYPAGQLHDGIDWPGRAHLLEHLLFLGSVEFPVENELDTWLNQHGGHSNAYTDLECTCYYMDGTTAALEGTMQRWSAALREPLLSTSVIEREINAVDSEHAKNKPQDFWRTYQLSKTLLAGGEDHPYGHFGSGCLASLLPASAAATDATATEGDGEGGGTKDATEGDGNKDATEGGDTKDNANEEEDEKDKAERINNLRQAVLEFWQRHYIAPNLTVAVLSNESLDDQQALVQKYFGNLRTGDAQSMPIPTIPPLPTSPPLGCRRIDYVPIRPVYTLELHWPLREIASLYQEKPSQVLSHLLGDEGPGSLLHVLRRGAGDGVGWVQELAADHGSRSTSAFSVFSLQMELTPTGWQHVNEIVALVYAYLHHNVLSPSQPLPPHVYHELKLVGEQQFEFMGISSSATDTVSSLTVQMHHYANNPKQYLSGLYKYFATELNQERFQSDFVQQMIPETMLMLVGAPEYGAQAAEAGETDKAAAASTAATGAWRTDMWYGTQHRVSMVEADTVEAWKNLQAASPAVQELATQLHLPQPNEFLPSQFDLVNLPPSITTKWFAKTDGPPVCILQTGLNDNNNAGIAESLLQLWYKPDTAFSMPKVNILISFSVPSEQQSMSSRSELSMLWTEWQNEVANHFAYAASMAGLHGEWVSNSKRATIELHVSGYSHKAALFLRRLLETTASSADNSSSSDTDPSAAGTAVQLNEELWERLVHKIRDNYQSFIMGQVYQHAVHYLDQCLEAIPTHRTIEQRLRDLEQLTVQDLRAFHHSFLRRNQVGGDIQILVHGNLTPDQAMEVGQFIPHILQKGQPIQSPANPEGNESSELKPSSDKQNTTTTATLHSFKHRIVQLPPQTHCVFCSKTWNDEDTNHCTLQYYPFGIVDLPTNACLSLLRHLIAEPAYNQLRTQEQLGYIVHSQLKTSGDHVKGLVLLVQGEAQDPVFMNNRMRQFWHTVRTQLVNMPTEEFASHRQALYENFVERKKNLLQESAAHWSVITNQSFHFTRVAEIAKHLLTRTKQDILRVLDQRILYYGSSLTIQMFGQGVDLPATAAAETTGTSSETETQLPMATEATSFAITDPLEFSRVQSLFPLPPAVPIEVATLAEEETS